MYTPPVTTSSLSRRASFGRTTRTPSSVLSLMRCLASPSIISFFGGRKSMLETPSTPNFANCVFISSFEILSDQIVFHDPGDQDSFELRHRQAGEHPTLHNLRPGEQWPGPEDHNGKQDRRAASQVHRASSWPSR